MPRTIGLLKKDTRSNEEKQADFLKWFEEYASVTRASKKSKVPRSTIYEWLKNIPEFKTNYEASCKIAIDVLQDEAIRRAHEGTVRPVYQGGEKVGSIREYSDTLLIFLLKGLLPETYKDRAQHEHSGKDGGPIETTVTHKVIFEDMG
jgi:hypothetical protein